MRLNDPVIEHKNAEKELLTSRRIFLHSIMPMLALPFVKDQTVSFFDEFPKEHKRDYSVCLNPDIILKDAELLDILFAAGVNTIWIAAYFFGHWPYDTDKIARARKRVMNKGMMAHVLTVPLGHPGPMHPGDESFPVATPSNWPRSVGMDGKIFAGISVNELVNAENAKALRELSKIGFKQCVLDDDFRVAKGPGVVGGSFDPATRDRFLHEGGYAINRWDELLQSIQERRLTNILRDWVNWNCDQVTNSFRIQQNAFDGDLGIMVMIFGSEKAGIRFSDFPNVSMRVGEGQFADKYLASPKGWTDELFSVLFHRRFVKPEKALSETTAFPEDALSVLNMSAKLTISTIADVRHTTFMSGLLPFPKNYWDTLSTAMHTQKRYHEKIAGHEPKGPLKHFWGEASRYVGKDKPFSLWLASGIPFEVIERLNQGQDGWIFMSDEDYDHLDSNARTDNLIVRAEIKKDNEKVLGIKEDLDALWQWKRNITPALKQKMTPYIIEEHPAVCAWYPRASCVLVWSFSEAPVSLTVQFGSRSIRKDYKPLESQLVRL
ncbi:MAG: hypothetical protein M9904_00260 [Chitinophagaceae bacterium]|nr:hypothetical protein [Chitinophagaceae bacterium]